MAAQRNWDVDESIDLGDDESWLTSYSDMMTDLLAIFVILFSFAMMAVAQQNYTMRADISELEAQSTGQISSGSPVQDAEFDRVYEAIQAKINDDGYGDAIELERGREFISFKFNDNLLFYPNSPTLRENSYDILNYIGDLMLSIEDHIKTFEFNGHTARIGEDSKTDFFTWELSADRAIAVLKFFVAECDLPQSKMVIAGFSHHYPVASNETEEEKALNRRVEVKIIRTGQEEHIITPGIWDKIAEKPSEET